jgi:hypothetical protein
MMDKRKGEDTSLLKLNDWLKKSTPGITSSSICYQIYKVSFSFRLCSAAQWEWIWVWVLGMDMGVDFELILL